MIRRIVKYGDPVLETPSDPVTEFGNHELSELVADMFETMYDAQGVGLAAPQIGIAKRVAVVDVSGGKQADQKLALINPQIVVTEGEQIGEEGCLSVPGFRDQVKRSYRVKARAQNVQGDWFEVQGEELLARAILHENDHLDGILFLHHLSPLKRELIKRKIRKLRKKGEWD